ncbi:DNA-protecting protein DprA [Candidatus Microgenomates bacterium]|nr:MAG: DNA-protecting protein DprA [Candidatus Microgenomates bacterium]
MDERFYYLAFSSFPGIGPVKFNALVNYFGNAKDAWLAKRNDLKNIIGEVLSEKFEEFRSTFSLDNYRRILLREGVSFLIHSDEQYPKLLKEIKNPPIVLYVKGNTDVIARRETTKQSPSKEIAAPATKVGARNDNMVIAVVGTRKITQYGREVTAFLTADLVNAKFTIVSGLALGVDAVAHKITLENKGKTIAVLGSGVDLCYPSANKFLYQSIIENGGAVVSEFPVGQLPTQGSFPSRNRIIAGLSMGVLVTEGAMDSGALITADYAIKNNRKVFAVPGPITSSLSKGPYKLISRGAKLVTNAEDILTELNFQFSNPNFQINNKSKKNSKTEDKNEQKILEILENEGLHFDEIVRRLKFGPSKTGSILSVMEIKGLIKSKDGIFSIIS